MSEDGKMAPNCVIRLDKVGLCTDLYSLYIVKITIF